jgi:hypothetical protein
MRCFLIFIAMLNDLVKNEENYLLFGHFVVIFFWIHLFIGYKQPDFL